MKRRLLASKRSRIGRHTSKLDQVYAIGDRVCAITEWSMMQKMHSTQPMLLKAGYVVTTYVREGDSWKSACTIGTYK
jgi:hypothetical protein